MSQYIIHAAPYSSPNARKNIQSKWNVQNLKVSQENPNAGGGVFASFDLVNTLNPKDKKYIMKFSFADGTSMNANIINRIRRFFNEAYDRQRSSSYGFPQLSDTEKTQIVARINTAYNQFAGFSHSDSEDVEIIDCTGDEHLEHSSARLQSVFKYTTEEGKHTYIPDRILTDKADHIGVAFYSSKDNGINVYVPINQLSNKNQIKVKFALALRNKDSKATIVPGTDDLMADLIAGRLSLSHSADNPDYLSVKMSDIDDNYLEHATNPYPYRPDVKLDGNQLVITFTDVTNNRTATLSVNLVGAKNYKDVEDRLDNLLQAAYADGKDWGNISKNAFDSIMRQARALNIFNDKTVSNRYRRNKSSI